MECQRVVIVLYSKAGCVAESCLPGLPVVGVYSGTCYVGHQHREGDNTGWDTMVMIAGTVANLCDTEGEVASPLVKSIGFKVMYLCDNKCFD